jgi:site-specific DNA-methyltransferase (adenine-specific)
MNMFFRITLDYDTLADEIVAKIPEKHFVSKTDTFLDPAFAGGQLLKAVAKRLNKYGHSVENIRSRLFGYEDSIAYINHPANYSTAMIANLSVVKYLEFLNMSKVEFDVVLGNPPYESATADGRKDQANNLWSKFTKKSFEIVKKDGTVAFVTPTSWLSPAADIGKGEKGIRFIRDYFQKLSVLYMNINECAKHFSVGSTFSYFVVKNTETDAFKTNILTDETSYTIDLRDIEYFPKTMNELAISINKKTLENATKFGFIGNNLPECKIEFVKEETSEYNIPAYHTSAKGGTYWYSKEHISTHSRKKVIVSISGEFNPVYDAIGELSFTNMCIVYYLDSGDNIESIKSFLESKLIKFLMVQNKYTGWIAPITHDLPNVDKTKIWTDEELYAHFSLTQEEINYIEANVK